MHPSYNGYAVLGTLKIVNLILWTFWTHARSIPILLSISASLLNGYAMVKEAFKLLTLLSFSWKKCEIFKLRFILPGLFTIKFEKL